MNRWTLPATAALLLLAGGALVGTAIHTSRARDNAEALRLFAAFDPVTGLSGEEVRALGDLQAGSTKVRAAFLRLATANPESAVRLAPHEQALSVALSQVDRRETRDLFGRSLLPCIAQATDVRVRRICASLMERWGLLDALPEQVRERLTEPSVERVSHKPDPEPENSEAPQALLDQLGAAQDARTFATIAFQIGEHDAPADVRDQAIATVVNRLARQQGSYELSMLDSALANLVKAGISPQRATTSAALLIERIESEHQIPDLLRVAVGLEAVAPKVPRASAGPLVARLVDRMRPTSGPSLLRAVAFNIGDFGAGASAAQVLAAARLLQQRIGQEHEAASLRLLTAGLMNLGDRVPENYLEAAADRAVQLMHTEPVESLDDLTAILDALGEHSEEQTGEAAAILVHRVERAQDVSEIENLAIAFGYIAEDADAPRFAETILRRIESEQRLPLLRALGKFLALLPDASLPPDRIARLLTMPDAPCIAAKLTPPEERDEAIARQILNPLCEQTSWEALAATIAPVNDEADDDDDESLADFHMLLVADDDGETAAEEGPEGYPIDFNRLSDAMDRFRPAPLRDNSSNATAVTGAVCIGLGLLLGAVLLVRRARTVY